MKMPKAKTIPKLPFSAGNGGKKPTPTQGKAAASMKALAPKKALMSATQQPLPGNFADALVSKKVPVSTTQQPLQGKSAAAAKALASEKLRSGDLLGKMLGRGMSKGGMTKKGKK